MTKKKVSKKKAAKKNPRGRPANPTEEYLLDSLAKWYPNACYLPKRHNAGTPPKEDREKYAADVRYIPADIAVELIRGEFTTATVRGHLANFYDSAKVHNGFYDGREMFQVMRRLHSTDTARELNKLKIEQETQKNLKLELANKQAAGELIEVGIVEEGFHDLAGAFVQHVESIRKKLKARVKNAADKKFIDQEVDNARTELADRFESLRRSARRDTTAAEKADG